MDVRIQALQTRTPNETKGHQPHLLFSNLASFEGLSNWCSAFALTKDWVKPMSFSRIGKVKSPRRAETRSFKSKRLNLSFVKSSASTLVSRGLQLSLHRMFIASHCERYSMSTTITGSLVLSFRTDKAPARPSTAMQKMWPHRTRSCRVNWKDLQSHKRSQELRWCTCPRCRSIIPKQPRDFIPSQWKRKPRRTRGVAIFVQEPTAKDHPILFAFCIRPEQLAQKNFLDPTRQLPVPQTKLVTNEDTSCCN